VTNTHLAGIKMSLPQESNRFAAAWESWEMTRSVIVVPCYNESLRLDAARFLEFARAQSDVRFLFVNDGSTDDTLTVLEELRRSDPERILVCALPTNMGKGEAVRRGMLLAFEAGAQYAGYWDADLSTPLDAISAFCSILDTRREIDMVFGARVSLLGRSVERDPVRHYLGRIFATSASAALGIGFYDTQCGAKLFRVSHELRSLFAHTFSTRWVFDVELIARCAALRRAVGQSELRKTVYEYPLHAWHDVAGSKVKPADFARALVELSVISWRHGSLAHWRRGIFAAKLHSRHLPGRVSSPPPLPVRR
jgi:glycosyltransferase involved in cell wall biosynthesis